jgi:hypothetical protein
MFFGVANDNTVIGLIAPQSDIEFISAKIKDGTAWKRFAENCE